MAKQVNTVTVQGVAIFPHLTQPNKKFNPDGVYEVSVRVDETTMKKLVADISPFINDEFNRLRAANKLPANSKVTTDLPYKPAMDKGQPMQGMFDVKAKQNAVGRKHDGTTFSTSVKLVNADLNDYDTTTAIWGGSVIKAAIQPYAWYAKGQLGFSFRLKAVQVLKLVTGNGGDVRSYGFEATEPEPTTGDKALSIDQFTAECQAIANRGN